MKDILLSMNPLQRLIAGAAIVLLVAGALYQFVYSKQVYNLKKETDKHQQLKTTLGAQDQDIQNLRAITAGNLDITSRHRQALRNRGNSIFTQASLDIFVSERLQELAEKAALEDFSATYDIASSENVLIDVGGGENTMLAKRVPVTVYFKSRYADFEVFLNDMFLENYYIRISSYDISSPSLTRDLEIQMKLYCYYEEES